MSLGIAERNASFLEFAKDADAGRVSHAYLVVCADRALRRDFLTLCAAKIACPGARERILAGRHVDAMRLDARDKITVEQTALAIENLYSSSLAGERKTLTFDNAELLSIQVQNKLLKVCEEPPAGVVVFFGAGQESALLPTLRSRCKKIYVKAASAEEIAAELVANGADRERAEAAAALADGSLEKAEKYCADARYREACDKVFAMMLDLTDSSKIAEHAYGELFEKDSVETTLDFMEIVLSDVMKLVTGGGVAPTNVGRDAELREIAKGFGAESVALAVFCVCDARSRIRSNMSASNVAANMWMRILEAKYKWRRK